LLLASCSKEEENKAFHGMWKVTESWVASDETADTIYYFIYINPSSYRKDALSISSVGGPAYQLDVYATVSGADFTIPLQSVSSGYDIYQISGKGNLPHDTLYFSYEVVDYWKAECTAVKEE
jgi:hypothetical protein